ncbi:HesB/IscA family protein [Alphaproteobacteria bacterium endosymbiont of Tiliacea citrago]|uniref:HesB/IscA family protein n=1 Tax=Alphaproteobacteria bacterium endosymbiont of Tiliacea citrago TaxID=3077944 RepID=UPI00313D49E0
MDILTITDEAKQYILDLCEEKGAIGISVDAIKGGCSGLQFKFNLENEHIEEERLEIAENRYFYIKKTALLFVMGSRLDHKKTAISSMLVFLNTKTSKQCGCGKSFV